MLCLGAPRPSHAISEQCPLRLVDAPPTNGSGYMGNLRQARGQPLRLREQHSLPLIFKRTGTRRTTTWPNFLLYAFPPIALILQVIRRIREQKHRVLLVAPHWRNLHWFAELSWLLTAAPWPTERFGTPSPSYGLYIFGLSMGAFGPSRESAKYYFLG